MKQLRDLQVFEQEVEDVEDWIADMEKQLASEDFGRDLISVNNLLKSHTVRILVKNVRLIILFFLQKDAGK